MTENIEKPLCLKMFFDEINNVFVFCFQENENSIFQFKLAPKDFENLTGDMVKTVKNYNLNEALKFQEEKNAVESKAQSACAGGLTESCCANRHCEINNENNLDQMYRSDGTFDKAQKDKVNEEKVNLVNPETKDNGVERSSDESPNA